MERGNPRAPSNWPFPINYYPTDLLPSTLFNASHWIELFLKSTLIDLGLRNISLHDIKALFTQVEREILGMEWLPINNGNQDILTQEEIDRIKQHVISELIPFPFQIDTE